MTKTGAVISVKVIPRSSKSEIAGVFDGALKVRLNAPPVDGEANKELIKLLSKRFGVPKSAVSIVRGENTRLKQISIDSENPSRLARKFEDLG